LEDKMATTPRLTRQKISTTVSPRTLEYLDKLTRVGEARNLAEALDLAVEKLLVYENRERLAADTDAYFANMTDAESSEERRLETALSQTSEGVDVDR
jgi:hypothetical protein